MAFSTSGNLIATLSEPWDDRFNDYMEVCDLTTGRQILRVDKWDSPDGLFFPPDETTLYASNRLYDLTTGEVISTMDVVPAAFTSDGKTYATGDYLGNPDQSIVQLVDVASGQEVFRVVNPGMVMYLNFSPDGRLLIGGFQVINNFVVKVWEISTGEVIRDLINYYSALIFSPDGNLAATTKAGQVYLFSGDNITYLASYPFMDPLSGPDTMDFSRRGDVLAIERLYNIIFVEPDSGKELLTLPDECTVKFSPNGTILVTWCYQKDLKIWGVIP